MMQPLWLLVLLVLWLALYAAMLRLARRGRLPGELPADWLAAGFILLVTVGYFWRVLLTTNAWMPAGGGDLAPFLYPNYHFAATSLRNGVIPLWNPHLYCGTPFAADIQSGLFYPVNLLIFLVWPAITYKTLEGMAIFHVFLAGIMMYVCLRHLHSTESQASLSRVASLAGAVAFMFSDLFVVHFGNLNMIAVAAWLPLIFLLFHKALNRRRPSLAAVSGAVLAVATLAGHIQITLFILITLGLYALWRGFSDHRPWQLARPLAYLALALLVSVGLSALALIPAYEMAGHTSRAALSYEEASRYSLNPAQLIGLLVPGYFGRDPALYWGPWDRVETGYIGILPLLLAITGLLLWRDRLKWFFTLLAGLAIMLALGGYGFLHGWLYALVPGFNQLRAPARFAFLLDFALASLAAGGLDALLKAISVEEEARVGRLLRLASAALLGGLLVTMPLAYFALLINQDKDPTIFHRSAAATQGLATFALLAGTGLGTLWLWRFRRLRGPALGWTAVSLICLDLFTLGANVDVGGTDPTDNFRHPAALAFLQDDPSLYRIEVPAEVWHLWQPNMALLYGLYDAWGLYNPLVLSDYRRFWEGSGGRNSALYAFLAVKYVVAPKGNAPGGESFVPVFDGDPDVDLYLNQGALPRALLLGRAISVESHEAAWDAVHQPDFDPRLTVIIERGEALQSYPQGSIAFRVYGLNEIEIAVQTTAPAYLVLSDVYYPGWQASVDGRAAPLYRANYAFRAIRVDPGEHQVRLSFAPLGWRVGLGLSLGTTFALLAWAGLAAGKGKEWFRRGKNVCPS
jgi:hypothetical protein